MKKLLWILLLLNLFMASCEGDSYYEKGTEIPQEKRSRIGGNAYWDAYVVGDSVLVLLPREPNKEPIIKYLHEKKK